MKASFLPMKYVFLSILLLLVPLFGEPAYSQDDTSVTICNATEFESSTGKIVYSISYKYDFVGLDRVYVEDIGYLPSRGACSYLTERPELEISESKDGKSLLKWKVEEVDDERPLVFCGPVGGPPDGMAVSGVPTEGQPVPGGDVPGISTTTVALVVPESAVSPTKQFRSLSEAVPAPETKEKWGILGWITGVDTSNQRQFNIDEVQPPKPPTKDDFKGSFGRIIPLTYKTSFNNYRKDFLECLNGCVVLNRPIYYVEPETGTNAKANEIIFNYNIGPVSVDNVVRSIALAFRLTQVHHPREKTVELKIEYSVKERLQYGDWEESDNPRIRAKVDRTIEDLQSRINEKFGGKP
jgi:hypothetical protein